jgi:hypothetical protein
VQPVFRVKQDAGQRVPRLVHGDGTPLVVGGTEPGALLPQQQPVAGLLHVPPGDHGLPLPRGRDGGLVDQIGEVGAAGLRHQAGQPGEVDVLGHRHAALADVQPEDGLPFRRRRQPHGHRSIEPPGSQQRRVEVFLAVGGADHQDMLPGREAVHLDQELVEGPVVLVMALIASPAAAEGVQLVDEDEAAPPARLAEEPLDQATPSPIRKPVTSLPLMGKKGTPALPPRRGPSRVFPVPGGPNMSTPFGVQAPTA